MASRRDFDGSGRSDEHPAQIIQLNALVVMQIIKQCEELRSLGEHAEGYLCGLLEADLSSGNRLEVTYAYPSLRGETTDQEADDYSDEMNRRLRQQGIDNMVVGWYKSAVFGSFLNREVFEAQYAYQSAVEESVVLIYDPVRTSQGLLTLKAYRLGPEIMTIVRKDGLEFSMESVRKAKMNVETLFQEIPIRIKNSYFVNAMLSELEVVAPSPNKRPFLDLSTSNVLEKNVGLLLEGVDHLLAENSKITNHQKRVQRLQSDRIRIVQRKNAQRQQKGEPLLTEDEINQMFPRPFPESPRADIVLTAAQVSQYCEKIGQFSAQSLSKMQMAEALQGKLKDSSAAFLSAIHKEVQPN